MVSFDLSNPLVIIGGFLIGGLVFWALGTWVKGLLVESQVKAARIIREEEREEKKQNDKPNLGRRI